MVYKSMTVAKAMATNPAKLDLMLVALLLLVMAGEPVDEEPVGVLLLGGGAMTVFRPLDGLDGSMLVEL